MKNPFQAVYKEYRDSDGDILTVRLTSWSDEIQFHLEEGYCSLTVNQVRDLIEDLKDAIEIIEQDQWKG